MQCFSENPSIYRNVEFLLLLLFSLADCAVRQHFPTHFEHSHQLGEVDLVVRPEKKTTTNNLNSWPQECKSLGIAVGFMLKGSRRV